MRCAECDGSSLCHNHVTSRCGTRGNPRYDGYCTHCFANLFPNDHRTGSIRIKSKETTWVNAILQTAVAAGHVWVWDRPLYVSYEGGCCDTKRRIDLWTLCGNLVVAVEIDERQHKSYAKDQEAQRYNDLLMDFTGRYVFLRINPDPFRSGGAMTDPAFEDRLALVEAKLAQILADAGDSAEAGAGAAAQAAAGDSPDLVTIHHMFYDE